MSYEDPNSGYTGADNSSSDVDYTQYCPYSSDENLSTRFFNSNVSVSSEQTDATEAPTEREDHYVRLLSAPQPLHSSWHQSNPACLNT